MAKERLKKEGAVTESFLLFNSTASSDFKLFKPIRTKKYYNLR